jgi:hypothetical protein
MIRPSTLGGLALAAFASTAALVALTEPAAAAEPACIPGFTTLQKETWILRCRKIVPLPQQNASLVQANKADCNFTSYWNYGPEVTSEINRARGTATIRYKCGHVES